MKRYLTNKIVLLFIAIVLVAAAVIPAVYFYRKYTSLASVSLNNRQEDPKALIARVAKHILLPAGENPTIMTVTDQEKLSGQVFFANAKNGDKVFIYKNAKMAYLYDPVMDKIIAVAPIVVTSPTPSGSPAASPSGQAVPPPAVPKIIIQ